MQLLKLKGLKNIDEVYQLPQSRFGAAQLVPSGWLTIA